MPITDPVVQRVAIIRQLARPSAKAQLGDEPLPELEDDPATAVASNGQRKPNASKWAKILYGTGLGADMISTARAIAKGGHEANPMLNFAGDKAAIPIALGQAAGSYWLLKKALGDRHPKLMNAILSGMGAVHGAAAVHNFKLPLDSKSSGGTSTNGQSSHPGMMQAPDGSWYDPNFITLPK